MGLFKGFTMTKWVNFYKIDNKSFLCWGDIKAEEILHDTREKAVAAASRTPSRVYLGAFPVDLSVDHGSIEAPETQGH
jgi:hypothetical protein